MHFVSALDTVPQMRAILTLFEGVATGAADGYARMAEQPAATLLHLGPGLGNGLANLHNARKGKVQSGIETVARNVSSWVRIAKTTEDRGRGAVGAVSAANGPPGQVATSMLPADVSWEDGAEPGESGPDDQHADMVGTGWIRVHLTPVSVFAESGAMKAPAAVDFSM